MKLRQLVFTTLLLISGIAFSQQSYDIKIPDRSNVYNKCNSCTQTFNTKPVEISIGVTVDADNNILFVTNGAEWFWKLISKGSDGLAADIVLKSSFDCDSYSDDHQYLFSQGDLQAPLYQKELKKIVSKQKTGSLL